MFGKNEDFDAIIVTPREGNSTTIPPARRPPRSWLDTEPYWRKRLGHGWKGTKILGSGSFGAIGHFRYQGQDNEKLKDIAVK